MQDNTITNFAAKFLLDDNEPTWSQAVVACKKPKRPKFTQDEDIELWLKHNAPLSFQQLVDLRYVLYHHCSRNDFLVTHVGDETFSLIGRNGTLDVISDNARKYLLWRLRQLGRKKSWLNAIPRTNNARY